MVGGGEVILPSPCWFSLNNSETVKLINYPVILQHSVTFYWPFLRNFVSLNRPTLQILGKTQTGVFPISGFLVNHLYKKIVRTPAPVTILT